MNTKGLLIHWMIFGVIISIGIFFLLSSQSKIPLTEKTKWSLDFLTLNYLPAEKNLLQQDSIARNVGAEAALELASRGGFRLGDSSVCGTIEGGGRVNLWNKGEVWCFPDLKIQIEALSKLKLLTRTKRSFKEISYHEDIYYGLAEKESISSEVGSYTFNPSFAVDLRYSFDEYFTVEDQAQSLVSRCRNDPELVACLANNKPSSWLYEGCEESLKIKDSQINARQIIFCVLSPKNSILITFDENAPLISIPNRVVYNLALDFTPWATNPIRDLTVNSLEEGFKLSFSQNLLADSYNIYYTNWEAVEEKKGSAEEVFVGLPSESLQTFKQVVNLNNPDSENCLEVKIPGEVYLCNGKIEYLLKDIKFEPEAKYFMAATSVKGSEEGEIAGFVEAVR